MGLTSVQGQRTQRPIPPSGLHPAICYAIIDMGTHQESFKGNVSNKPKVKFCFEFPTLPEQVFDEAKGPQRLSIMQDFNVYSDDKSNLCKMLKQWRGVAKIDLAKDLPAYLGQSCQVMVTHVQKDDITYANIAASGTMILPPTANYGAPKNNPILFDLDKFSWQQFHSLWPFLQKKIRESLDWQGIIAKFGQEPQNGQQAAPQQQAFQQAPAQQTFQAPQYQQPAFAQPQQPVFQQPVAPPQQQVVPQQQTFQQAPPQMNAPQTGIFVGNDMDAPPF
ncbi:MAG: hypothetical protein RIR01_1933 [Bacteroidota bacterium]|jgi:hypothetical protein